METVQRHKIQMVCGQNIIETFIIKEQSEQFERSILCALFIVMIIQCQSRKTHCTDIGRQNTPFAIRFDFIAVYMYMIFSFRSLSNTHFYISSERK